MAYALRKFHAYFTAVPKPFIVPKMVSVLNRDTGPNRFVRRRHNILRTFPRNRGPVSTFASRVRQRTSFGERPRRYHADHGAEWPTKAYSGGPVTGVRNQHTSDNDGECVRVVVKTVNGRPDKLASVYSSYLTWSVGELHAAAGCGFFFSIPIFWAVSRNILCSLSAANVSRSFFCSS